MGDIKANSLIFDAFIIYLLSGRVIGFQWEEQYPYITAEHKIRVDPFISFLDEN